MDATSQGTTFLRQSSDTNLRELLSDDVAFEAWYRTAMPKVYAYTFGRCGGDAALAEEITQIAFIDALRNADRWTGRADLVTWIIAIARNKLADHARARSRERRRNLRLLERAEPVPDAVTVAEGNFEVQRALGAMPADQRLALVLHVADGMTIREVAAAFGRSEDAAESLIRRARASFRRAYGDSPGD